MKLVKIWLLWLPLLAASTHAFSQNSYPVHVTVQVLPPYGLYLSDYYSGARDRLVITLLNRDVGQNTLQVKLRLTIKNGSSFSLQSRDELYYPMITLPSGIPFRLTNSDIVPYLTPDRVSVNGYLQNGKLPVGMTEFSVQAFDYVTGLPLSFVATGRAWLELKQPPILNLPEKDEYVEARTPQYIRFQWMPRHQGVAATVYQFTLRELPDNGAVPQSAFLYGNPVYQTETRFSTINYTHLEPLLSPGKRYGWQVRAIAMDGVDEIGLFDNNGYSEVGWFRLSDNTPAPLNVTAQAGYRKMTIDWQLLPDQNTYVVQYRPKSERDLYDWTSTQTSGNTLTAYDLTAGWTYEYRVGTLGLSQNPVFSPVGEVTLPMDDEDRLARCGMVPQVDLSNQNPNESLAPGQVVIIGGDFPMTVTEVFPQGSGWYSGKGYITMPWVFQVKVLVQFDRLRVNTDNRQIGGAVETQYDPTASQIANLNELDQGGSLTTAAGIVFGETVKLDFTIPPIPEAEYDPKTDVLVIYDDAGTPHQIDIPKNDGKSAFPFIVEDDQGNKYQIDLPDSGGGEGAEGETADKIKPIITPIKDATGGFDTSKLDSRAGITVRFSNGSGKYAFDPGAEPWYQTALLIRDLYKPFGTTQDGEDYIAPWKLIPAGENDTVEAKIATGNAEAGSISFALQDGKGVAARQEGDKWILSLPSVGAGQTYEVFALYENGKDNFLPVGKLNVVSYGEQRKTVTLVPVTGMMPDVPILQDELNAIYIPYNVTFTIDTDQSIQGNMDWDSDNDGKLNLSGSGFFSNETAEMKALRKIYQATDRYDPNGYYIFVMDEAMAGDEPDQRFAVQGDMPRGKQFGYIFTKAVDPAQITWLTAHELGHGVFTLEHSFNANYSTDKLKGQTDNLMDYNSGLDLAAFQWNVMANPAPLTWFDSEEDAMASTDKNVILVSDKLMEETDINGKTIEEIQKVNNANLIYCDKKIALAESKIPRDYIYYFGEKPDFKLYPVSVNKDGKLSMKKYKVDYNEKEYIVHFKNIMVNGTKRDDVEYEVLPDNFNPHLLYNSANPGSAKSGTAILGSLTVYGLNKLEYKLDYASDADELKFIKSIKWNEEEAKSSGFCDWMTDNINTVGSSENKITVTPIFGEPVVYTIKYKPAPVLTVTEILNDRAYPLVDGTVGLDNWQLYKTINKNEGLNQKYNKHKITIEGKEYYTATIIVTPKSPGLFKLQFQTIDSSWAFEAPGLGWYKLNDTEYVSMSGGGAIEYDVKKAEKNTEISITDAGGRPKGKMNINFVKTEKTYDYRIVRFAYVDAQNNEHTAKEFDLGYLDNIYAQLGIEWKGVTEEIMTIDDSDISKAVTAFGSKISINADQIKQIFSGKTNADILNEIAKDDLQRVLLQLSNNKGIGKDSKIYDIVFMPNDIGVNGFAPMNGNVSFISPNVNGFTVSHELGHNLNLNHIGVELGKCVDNEDKTESTVKTNNIMGYGSDRNSFWLWQKERIIK